jgi:hypothetical protein
MRRFTITTSWNALSVELSQTFQAAHYLTPSILAYGLGESVISTGVPLQSNQFQGYSWTANVRATAAQFYTLTEMRSQYSQRNADKDTAFLVLKDEVNRYPENEYTKNSRAKVSGSDLAIGGINTAYLTFPCRLDELIFSRVLRIDSDYDIQLQLTEVP